MAIHSVEKTVAADPAAVWKLLATFGDIHWIPAATEVRTEGEGVGMTRHINGAVIERLLAIDEPARTMTYAIEQGNPLPVSRYESTAVVRGGDGASEATVTWTVDYDPTGPDEAARGGIDAIYGVMAGWLQDAATA